MSQSRFKNVSMPEFGGDPLGPHLRQPHITFSLMQHHEKQFPQLRDLPGKQPGTSGRTVALG
jgi:hypothetical protein